MGLCGIHKNPPDTAGFWADIISLWAVWLHKTSVQQPVFFHQPTWHAVNTRARKINELPGGGGGAMPGGGGRAMLTTAGGPLGGRLK